MQGLTDDDDDDQAKILTHVAFREFKLQGLSGECAGIWTWVTSVTDPVNEQYGPCSLVVIHRKLTSMC